MNAVSPEVLRTLAQYDSPTICNVIEQCGFRPRNSGYMNERIRAIYPELPAMVGHAVTATFRSCTQAGPDERSLGLIEQIAAWQEVPEPRVMVIQDLDDPPDGAVYGEIVATVCQAFGCVGLVTNGYARDILQVRALNFPCFAAGICVSHSYCRVLSIGEPVTIGGVRVRSGDLLHGDANGVTTIPFQIADQVAAACAEFVEAENVLIDAAKARPLSLDSYRAAAAEFAKRIDAISKRLSGQAADQKVGV
jgi:regulator of RNase E activity RraA